jgi:hypothetical protein
MIHFKITDNDMKGKAKGTVYLVTISASVDEFKTNLTDIMSDASRVEFEEELDRQLDFAKIKAELMKQYDGFVEDIKGQIQY